MAEKKKQKRPTRPRRAADELPPIPSNEAVRLGALRMLTTLVMERKDAPRAFALRGKVHFGDECLDSPEETFARMVAYDAGDEFRAEGIMAGLGVSVPVLVCGLFDLARGAEVQWTPRKAVA